MMPTCEFAIKLKCAHLAKSYIHSHSSSTLIVIYEVFRGKISLKSLVGAGTLVTVRLPLSQPDNLFLEGPSATNMLDLHDIQRLEEPMGQGVAHDAIMDTQACQAKSVRQLLVQPVESGIAVRLSCLIGFLEIIWMFEQR